VRKHRAERGQNLIEFAIVAPFVLLFIAAIVVFGLAMNARSTTQHAVREGARLAAVGGTLPEVKDITAGNAPDRVDEDDVKWCHPGSGSSRGEAGSQVVVFLDEDGAGPELGVPFTLAATGGIFSIFGVGDVTVQLNPRATARLEKSVPNDELVTCPAGIP
jgi:hypothetical protein